MTKHAELIERVMSKADVFAFHMPGGKLQEVAREALHKEVSDALEAQEREIEALRKDAERWRWLAENCDGDDQDDFTNWLYSNVAPKESIDARADLYILAAIAAKGGGHG